MAEIAVEKRVFLNNKHSAKISYKRRESFQMRIAINDYLKWNKINIPSSYKEFKHTREKVMDYEAYDDSLDKEFTQLIKLYYDLGTCNKAVYALFDNKGAHKSQILACWYSKHRLDPVWNYRKSQLIRKIYKNFLTETQIHKKYHPVHMVLTVPHKDGKWNGKEFYAKELMEAFNLMRKSKLWKKYIYAGEYGIEVKKSPLGNGLHIHLHSLIFQHKEYTVNEVRDFIESEWRLYTGNEEKYSGIHYETLFYFKRDQLGQYEKETKYYKDGEEWKSTEVRKKFYIDENTPDEDYISGIMECIKYHFKHDSIKDKNNEFDVPLIRNILNNSRGLRMYSRFGKFYSEPQLCFNNLEKKVEDQTEEEIENEVMASSAGVEENLINPFTKEPAKEGEYQIGITMPEMVKHRGKKSETPFEPVIYLDDIFFKVLPGINLKEVMKNLARGKIEEIFTYPEYQRYIRIFITDN